MNISVISIDALLNSDLPYFKSLPNMGRFLSVASVIPKITTIYPTYTYPCHASIMTGCYPGKTGVFHNYDRATGDWKWYRKSIKVPLITDYTAVKSAAVMWPVLGGADIDILVPEIWADGEFDDPDERFLSASSPLGYEYYKKHKDKLYWMRTPHMDNFAASVYADIIRNEMPEISFLHLSYLDHQRHNNGSESESVLHAISFIDEKIGEVLEAFDETETFDDTLFIILGDHGHRNFTKQFYLQEALDRKGYKGRISSYNVSLSSQIYLTDISQEEAIRVLEEIGKENPGAIDKIFTPEELDARYKLKGDFDLMVEAGDLYAFRDESSDVLVKEVKKQSSHGFMPEKGPFSPLIFSGCGFWTDESECDAVDIAPTILSIMGCCPNLDGKVLSVHKN